jgi:hypothetical protein
LGYQKNFGKKFMPLGFTLRDLSAAKSRNAAIGAGFSTMGSTTK